MNIKPIGQTPHQALVGNHFCQKMQTMVAAAIALHKIAEFGSRYGARATCTGVTIATGLANIVAGNILTGGIMTVAGVKEGINIYQAVHSTSDLKSLLDDATAGVDMIKTLEEANRQSFKTVDANLEVILANMEEMNERMATIEALSNEGQEVIEESKQHCLKLYEEAKSQFSSSQDLFEKAQGKLTEGNAIFKKALTQFKDLFELAQKNDMGDKDKLDEFIRIAKSIQQECVKAQTLIEEGNSILGNGILSLNGAIKQECTAYGESVRAMEQAKNHLALIKAQAQTKKEYEQKIKETQQEVKDVQTRQRDIETLLEDVSGDLKQAREASDTGFGNMSILFGVIPGAVAGFGAGGWIGAAAGAYGLGQIVHNRRALAHKVDTAVNGPVTQVVVPSAPEELITITFNSRSTGFWNRFVRGKNQSYTKGKATLSIGSQQVAIEINLNDKNKISKPNQLKLQKMLKEAVLKREISAEKALKLVAELENKCIGRGTDHNPQVGLIPQNSSYFNEVVHLCQQQIATAA